MPANQSSRFQGSQKPVLLTGPVRARIGRIKAQLEKERDRQVSASEVLEVVLDHYDATDRLARDARETGR